MRFAGYVVVEDHHFEASERAGLTGGQAADGAERT